MWGLFRKRSRSGDDADVPASPAPAPAQETEPIDLGEDGERSLEEGVGVGEHPSKWVDQAIAARGERRESDGEDAEPHPDREPNPFAPLGLREPLAPTAEAEPARAEADPAEPAEPVTPDPEPTAAEPEPASEPDPEPRPEPEPLDPAALEAARDRWREQLAGIGGASSLRRFRGERGTYIDLTTAHPSGIATLLTGRPVMLTSLLREPLAFRNALDAAELVAQKGAELEAARGISCIHLAIGLASWTTTGGEVRCPVLLRAASLRRLGRDYELRLRGRVQPNATLLRALYDDGVTVRAGELMERAGNGDTLLPELAFEHLRQLGAELPGFVVDARAALSSFGDVAEALAADADDLAHPMLDALAGDPVRRARLGGPLRVESPIDPDHRDPAADRLLLDADTEQERVVDAVLGGSNLVVETLPGTGVTQTVVNTIGQLVDRDRRVLVVTPRAASVRAIRARLRAVGLDGLAVTPRTLRRDSIAAISRNEQAQRPTTAELDDALVRLRHALADFRDALGGEIADFGASPFDALEALSRLELLDVPPSTTARLDRATVVRLAAEEEREAAAERLRELSALGAFRYRPEDSPWYGVVFASTEEVADLHGRAKRLADGRVAELLNSARGLVGQTNLRPPESLGQLGVYLRLLADIRETLDRFTSEVFDADLPQLIEATGGRREGSEMSASRRRELRAVARDLVRPGVSVGDLHDSLKYVHRQRILWHRYVADGALPNVPTGIEQVRREHRDIVELVRPIDEALGDVGEVTLSDTPVAELAERLEALAADSGVLDDIVERIELSERLRAEGLGPLLEDLLDRRIEGDAVADELEQAWWQSVLEFQLQEQKALLNANTRVLTRLEHDFRVVDEAHNESSAEQLAWQLAQTWKVDLVDHADEAEALRALLRGGAVNARLLVDRAARLSRSIAQVWVTTPYDVPRIDDRIRFDTLLLVDAGDISTAEAVGAIRRATQVVAFGDPVTQAPAPFSIAVRPRGDAHPAAALSVEAAQERADDSVFARLAEFLPTVALTRSYRTGGEDLAEFVNERFYGGRLESMPWAGAFLGHSSLTYSYVRDGTGMPDPRSGAVEATDAEVTRVVELVLDHAIHRPQESLMVISASPTHAQRVEQAVWSAVSNRPEVVDFFTERRSEPFLVTTIEHSAALARDRVVFSLGYGITPHGRVLSDFGVLATPLGERALAVAMTRARRSLVLVSCIRPAQLDLSRMTAGTIGLAEILTELEERTEAPGVVTPLDEERAPMLVDLARRLAALGMRVDLDHRGSIPLAAAYGQRAIAIDLDARRTERAPTLREQLRLRPAQLKRLGWYYLRVHAFELFANPEAVARRIATALEVPLPEERGPAAGAVAAGERAAEIEEAARAEIAAADAARPDERE